MVLIRRTDVNVTSPTTSTLILDIQATPPLAGAAMAPLLARGLITAFLETGEIEVVIPPDAERRIRCDFLETAENASLPLGRGDLVLVMLPAGAGQNGCVLGRVGRYPAQPKPKVVIEAGERLTLKCGDSSIDLRRDGKLVVRGNDVLSRATRTNRIKGGSVAIN
jgi:hypothetical protein